MLKSVTCFEIERLRPEPCISKQAIALFALVYEEQNYVQILYTKSDYGL